MFSDDLVITAGARRSGRTTKMLEWLQQGERVGGYPGWSRILIVGHTSMDVHMRSMPLSEAGLQWWLENTPRPVDAVFAMPETWWTAIPDWSHRVYDVRSLAYARSVRLGDTVELGVDDYDHLVSHPDFSKCMHIGPVTRISMALPGLTIEHL